MWEVASECHVDKGTENSRIWFSSDFWADDRSELAFSRLLIITPESFTLWAELEPLS